MSAPQKKPLSAADWDRIRELFDELSEKSGEHRVSMLKELEESSPEIHYELQSLLRVYDKKAASKPVHLVDSSNPNPPVPEIRALPKIENYRLLRQIGSGGMGHIYLAELEGVEGFKKYFALKSLSPQGLETPEARQLLEIEAKILSRLVHPGIIQVFDYLQKDGHYFLVMELVDGKNLEQVLQRMSDKGITLPLKDTLFIFQEIAKALQYAHEFQDDATQAPLGLVHRDITPRNIMISISGTTKLLDFGIAKFNQREKLTAPGNMRGTIAYMAPEILTGKPATAQTDIFSLTLVLCDMLFGLSASHVLYKVRLENLRSAPLSFGLKAFLKKGLARNPEERYGSVREMLKDLQGVLSELKEIGSPESTAASLWELFPEGVRIPRREDPDARAKLEMQANLKNLKEENSLLTQTDPSQEMGIPDAPRWLKWLTPKTKRKPIRTKKALAFYYLKRIFFFLIPICLSFWIQWREPLLMIKNSNTGLVMYSIGEGEQLCPIKVGSSPNQAIVQVDGAVLPQATPVKLLLSCRGSHFLVLKKEGFQSQFIELSEYSPREQNIQMKTGVTSLWNRLEIAWSWAQLFVRLNIYRSKD